jgi:hypothetical protein
MRLHHDFVNDILAGTLPDGLLKKRKKGGDSASVLLYDTLRIVVEKDCLRVEIIGKGRVMAYKNAPIRLLHPGDALELTDLKGRHHVSIT